MITKKDILAQIDEFVENDFYERVHALAELSEFNSCVWVWTKKTDDRSVRSQVIGFTINDKSPKVGEVTEDQKIVLSRRLLIATMQILKND